jgi:uncharacterized protein YfaT (DUF1175 family)
MDRSIVRNKNQRLGRFLAYTQLLTLLLASARLIKREVNNKQLGNIVLYSVS